MTNLLTKLMAGLTEEELEKAYFEIKEWKYKSGILPNGIIRKVHSEYEKNAWYRNEFKSY